MSVSHGFESSSDLAFQAEALQGVSRTFALTIPQLPDALRDVVGNAYLLCRIADTIEDEPTLSLEQKQLFSRQFLNVIAGSEKAEAFARDLSKLLSPSTNESEHDLIANTAKVIRVTKSFSPFQQDTLERCVRTMSCGMEEFQKRENSSEGLDDLPHLDRYCYFVAGVVGEMLTELFCDYSSEIHERREELLKLSVSFGQGLQMTNILKDIWDDLSRGACWLPRDIFHEAGHELSSLPEVHGSSSFTNGLLELIAIARNHLENALRFILIIPTHETGIRLHCLWALGMAVLTLRKVYANPAYKSGQEVKISRRSVRAVILVTNTLVRSNLALKLLFWALTYNLPQTGKNSLGRRGM